MVYVPIVRFFTFQKLIFRRYIIFAGNQHSPMKPNGLLNLALKQVADYPLAPCNAYRFISDELGLVRSIAGVQELNGSLIVFGQPYRLTEGRILLLRSGSVRIRANLHELEIHAHHLIVASPGTIVEFMEMSANCDLVMLGFANGFMENWQKEELLLPYLQGRLYLCLSLEQSAEQRLESIFSLLWEVINDIPFPREIVQSLISAVFQQIAYFRKNGLSGEQPQYTRQEEIFNRFINLVNKYAIRERSVSFYANRLCLTPRYLGTLIRQSSSRTVMEWINEAIIQEAKILLCHSDKLVYQIADELNFPNASFFCKFYRRITGTTPHEYRTKALNTLTSSRKTSIGIDKPGNTEGDKPAFM